MSSIRIEAFDASVRDSNAWLRSMMHYLATKDRRIACIAPRDSGIDPVGAARAAAALLHERLAPLEPRR